MSKNYNVSVVNTLAQVSAIGRATKDAEARFTPSGTKVANVNVAFSRRWMDEKETDVNLQWKEETTFIAFAVWGESADRAGRIRKGDIISVEFSMADLKADLFTKNDGTSSASLKVNRCSISRIAWDKDAVDGAVDPAAIEGDYPEAVAPVGSIAFP